MLWQMMTFRIASFLDPLARNSKLGLRFYGRQHGQEITFAKC